MSRVFVYSIKGFGRLIPGLFLLSSILFSCSSSHTPETHTVVIKGMKFLPEELDIKKGDTVEWINKDLVMHDITEETNKTWTSGILESDASWKMAINEDTDYFCNLHVVMKGKIVIQ